MKKPAKTKKEASPRPAGSTISGWDDTQLDLFEQEREVLDEDTLASLVGVNRRAFHDDD